MKKKILAVALAVAMLAIVGYNTIAYFTSSDSAVNTITAGTLAISLNEYKDGTVVEEGEDGIVRLTFDNVQPGDTCAKVAKVECAENNIDAWIRVKVTMEWDKASLSTGTDIITLGIASGWELDEDGYYYFNSKVAAESITDFLNDVKFSLENMNNDYQGAVLTITLEAEAVQFANNGASANAANGWPTDTASDEGDGE